MICIFACRSSNSHHSYCWQNNEDTRDSIDDNINGALVDFMLENYGLFVRKDMRNNLIYKQSAEFVEKETGHKRSVDAARKR